MAFTRVVGPGIHTASNINSHNIKSTGIITAVSFVGDGSGLTGVASTDYIITGTAATFTGGVNINDLSVTGNVTIGGTLTYEDVKNVDSIGVITARSGIQGIGIQSGGLNVAVGVLTALNFIGAGNTFKVTGSTVDISIQGGGGGAGAFTTSRSGIQTSSSLVGIGTTNADDNDLQGVGSSSTPTTTIAVTVGADSVSGQATGVFYFDGVEKPASYQIERGMTFIFDQSDSSNEVYGGANHPLMFSLGPGGDHNGNGHYLIGVQYKLDGVNKTMAQYTTGFNAATTREVVWTIPTNAPNELHYWCHHHTNQGNSFSVVSPAKGLYISNGMMIMDNSVHGNHYIGTNFNGLMAGPVNVNGTITIDGNYVVV